MEHPAAAGEAFNIGNEKPVTQVEMVRAYGGSYGQKSEHGARAARSHSRNGRQCLGEPAYFGTYFDLPPITENVTKVARILSVKPTPFDQGLRETYRWYLRNGRRSRIDFSFEDKLLAFAQPEGGAGISLLRAD